MSKRKNKPAEETVEASQEEVVIVSEEIVSVVMEETLKETPEGAGDIAAELPSAEQSVEAGESAEAVQTEEEEINEPSESETPIVRWQLSQVVEAILFASQKPMSVKELQAVLKGAAEAEKENPSVAVFAKVPEGKLRAAIEVLELACMNSPCAHEVRETAAGWQLVTKPEFSPWLRQLFPENRSARLSAPAMETLAIIAYRQPITRADIEAVRGVAVDGVMQTLLDRGLVKIAGRSEIPGRPLLYETTVSFMEHFGLKDLDDLPNASELRKIELPQAPISEEPAQPVVTEPASPALESEVSTETEAPAPDEPEKQEQT